jgi:hypothetical protein
MESFGKWFGEHALFSELIESDKRAPFVTFTVPESILGLLHMEGGGNRFGLLAPSIEFWIALITSLLIGATFNACLCCIIYKFIVLPQKDQKKRSMEGSMTGFIVGFGLVIPLCAAYPYYANRYFCTKNKVMKFLNVCAQVTTLFRCSEAMFGFLPTGVDSSLSNLMIYNAVPVEVRFDKNAPVKSTWGDVSYNFVNWVKYIFILGLYSSIMHAYEYQPYPSDEGPTLFDINIRTGFSREQMINNFSAAVLLQIYLTTFGFGLNFITGLAGVKQLPMMLNPMFESTSVSDFWGRR